MSSFRLHSGDSEFNTRVDALFSSLQTVEVDLKTPGQGTKRPHEDDEDREDNIHDKDDGEFCRPQGMPPPWRGGRGRGQGSRGRFGPRNSTPDYVKNPHNWTRYSMKDTKVLSDRENKIEGLKLFHDLQSQRMQEERGHNDDEESDKIVFKKPLPKPPIQTITSETGIVEDTIESVELDSSADALFGGTQKFKMAQYEVGKSKSKSKSKKEEKKAKNEKETSSKEVKLGYLMFEEEEDS